MSETDIAFEAEHLLRGLADELTRPRQRECLACFVARMLNEFGCDETLRFARRYRDQAAQGHRPRATARRPGWVLRLRDLPQRLLPRPEVLDT